MIEPIDPADRMASAVAWRDRLWTALPLTADTLREFWSWRQDPLNREAFEALDRSPRVARYVVRPDREAFSVIDVWTGQAAVIAMTPQTGISELDAEHTAGLLNRRAAGGDRTLLQ